MDLLKIIDCDFSSETHRRALIDLMNEYMLDGMGDYPPLDKEREVNLLKGLEEHPSKLVLFAEDNGKFIGLTNCYINFATFAAKPFINIHDIIVSKESRGKGVGRILLGEVIERAKKMGCSKITLEVREDNINAQKLYANLGFEELSPRMYFRTKHLHE